MRRPSSAGLKVFFSGCGYEFSWFFSRQRWKIFPSATHALEAIGSNAIFLWIPSLIPLQDHLFLFSFLVLHDLYLQKHMFNHTLLQEVFSQADYLTYAGYPAYNNNNNIIYIALTPLIDQSALQFIILK